MCSNCQQINTNCECNDCNQGCPINLDASCVFYNLTDTNPSALTCVGLPNGTNLKTILEEFDNKLCSIVGFSYADYNLYCLREGYTINTNRQFSEAVAREICLLKTGVTQLNSELNADINSINSQIQALNIPSITDNCFLGILPTDTLKTILQKLADKLCEIVNINFSDQSPILNATDSNTIRFVTSGTKNHNILATVKVSPDSGNSLQTRSNGLYVPTVAAGLQTLSYNAGTRTITLSNGGGSVTLPVDNDAQTLSFNPVTKFLSISGANSVDLSSLSSLVAETSLSVVDTSTIDLTASGTANHTLSAAVKISAASGNQVSANPDGLFVPQSSYNPTLSDIVDLLTDIDGDAGLKAQLYGLIVDSLCFKFRLKNTGVGAATYDYVDCSGGLQTGLSLGAGASVDITGKSVDTLSTDIEIYNLGLN